MDVKMITRVDSTAKSAAISKYSPNRQGGESGRRQKSPDSYKPKTENKEENGLNKFFASTAKSPSDKPSDFELMLRKKLEDNTKMQESTKSLEQSATATAAIASPENSWIWGISGNYRPIIRK